MASLHPLHISPDGRHAELAGVSYFSSGVLQAKDGRSVVYLTEAPQSRHLFKYIGALPDGEARGHGALYVARLGAQGHGRWLPLLPARQGFLLWDAQLNAGDVLASPSEAALRAGATRFDDLFGLSVRADGGQLSRCGHAGPALVWREALSDAASLSFAWSGPDAVTGADELPAWAYGAPHDSRGIAMR